MKSNLSLEKGHVSLQIHENLHQGLLSVFVLYPRRVEDDSSQYGGVLIRLLLWNVIPLTQRSARDIAYEPLPISLKFGKLDWVRLSEIWIVSDLRPELLAQLIHIVITVHQCRGCLPKKLSSYLRHYCA